MIYLIACAVYKTIDLKQPEYIIRHTDYSISLKTARKKYSYIMEFETLIITEEQVRREREKARSLRRTAWWNRKVQEGVCYYCHRKVGKDQLTMDHVVPLSRGGKSRKGNIVAACKECNNRKKYLLPLEWDEYLKSLASDLSETSWNNAEFSDEK